MGGDGSQIAGGLLDIAAGPFVGAQGAADVTWTSWKRNRSSQPLPNRIDCV